MQPLVSENLPVTKTEAPPKKLDLSHVTPPENVEEMRIEEITIDGICCVY